MDFNKILARFPNYTYIGIFLQVCHLKFDTAQFIKSLPTIWPPRILTLTRRYILGALNAGLWAIVGWYLQSMFFSQTKRMIQSWWLRYYVIQANDHHWLLLLQNFAMGNSNSTPEPAPGTEKRRSSLFHTTEDDLGRLARIKKAEDARKEAIAANTHDNIKVGWWNRYSKEGRAGSQFECRLWSWDRWSLTTCRPILYQSGSLAAAYKWKQWLYMALDCDVSLTL